MLRPPVSPTPRLGRGHKTTTPTSDKTLLEQWVKRVGEMRDGVLTVGGILYLSGFFVVQFTARRNNLGFLPVPASQYFLAGIAPTVLLASFWAAVHVGYKAADRLSNWMYEDRREENHRFYTILFLNVLSLELTFFVNKWTKGSTNFTAFLSVITLGYVASILSSALVADRSYTLSERSAFWVWVRNMKRRIQLIGLLLVVPWALFYVWNSVFLNGIYPKWPQEFGGMQPRRAYLDLTRASISEETQAALLKPGASDAKKKSAVTPATVVRSEEVEVAFEGSDYYIVRPRRTRDITTYRLRKDAVQAVIWLAGAAPAEPKTSPTPSAPTGPAPVPRKP